MKNTKILILAFLIIFTACQSQNKKDLPAIIVSTDIGGSDPDDYQSLVHLLVYANKFDIKGLVSSPPNTGRKENIDEVIDCYEKDFENLKKHSDLFPTPDYLYSVTKQGAIDTQAKESPETLSEGAEWIIKQAIENPQRDLYILVWGSITDVAQAVHRNPDIKSSIRVYSIGSWNTVQDTNSRNYLYTNHPDLWWIENNTTFRGMYMGGYQDGDYGNEAFVESNIKGHGCLGELFWNKKKDIKMGDTPSVLYFLSGNPNNPEGDSWGGSFIKTTHGPQFWTDNPVDSLTVNNRPGAKTVSKYRKQYLDDWKERMDWLIE